MRSLVTNEAHWVTALQARHPRSHGCHFQLQTGHATPAERVPAVPPMRRDVSARADAF